MRFADCSLKYWDRLNRCSEDKILYKTLLDLTKLHNDGHPTWVTKIHAMIKESCSDEDSFNNLLNGSKNIYFDTKNARHNKFKELWHRNITNTSKNPKLRTYITFKHNLEISAY